jgi:hypothetical protein
MAVENGGIIKDCKRMEMLRLIKEGGKINHQLNSLYIRVRKSKEEKKKRIEKEEKWQYKRGKLKLKKINGQYFFFVEKSECVMCSISTLNIPCQSLAFKFCL